MAGLNDAPMGERVHIGFFGLRNAGKSSLVNAVTAQDLAVVSDVKGTTTDIVKKAMELLPIGPVVIVDTPGIDDSGPLGDLRVQKAKEALRFCDVAVLVSDCTEELQPTERDILALFAERDIPFVIAFNKCDRIDDATRASQNLANNECFVSALTGEHIYELKELIARSAHSKASRKQLIGDLVAPGDMVVLVIPIDDSAPKSRIILPQQMVLRDVLDTRAMALACQPKEVVATLASLRLPPAMVVTDSQVFELVSELVPDSIPLTSFSILMARYKGNLHTFIEGARALSNLPEGGRVLVSEGCTHHRQCEDIGTVKMPRWIQDFSRTTLHFDFSSGGQFPETVHGYDLIVHCGGCMLNEKEMLNRMKIAHRDGVPIVNYGIAIAHMHGILQRSLRPFGIEV